LERLLLRHVSDSSYATHARDLPRLALPLTGANHAMEPTGVDVSTLPRPMGDSRRRSWFTRLTKWTCHVSGRSSTFLLAVLVILIWAITGPEFGFSNTWQLVINTATTIVTFLMVFLIQSTQNRDSEAMQIKLDEIIRSIEGAKNELLDLEELEDDELERMRDVYEKLAA